MPVPVCLGVPVNDLPPDFKQFINNNLDKIIGLASGVTEIKEDDIDFFVTFLFSANVLLSKSQREVQEELGKSVTDISLAIGQRAMAIWITDPTTMKFDIEKNLEMIKHFEIKNGSKKAPHLVITTKYPPKWSTKDDVVCISFNRINSNEIHKILSGVVDSIRNNKMPYQKGTLTLRMFYEAIKNGVMIIKMILKTERRYQRI